MVRRIPHGAHRYPPDPYWERSKEFQQLIQMLLHDPAAPLPTHLTDAQRIAVEAEVASRRWPKIRRGDYRKAMERAMDETRLRCPAPVTSEPTRDLLAAWQQPEAKAFWQRCLDDKVIYRSSVATLQTTLATMLVAGGMRTTPHIRQAHDILHNHPLLWELASTLSLSCDGVLKCRPIPRSYGQVTRRLSHVSEGLAAEAHTTLAEIAQTFAGWGFPVGRYLVVDGSLVPAWAPQRSARINGKWSPALEDRLRRRAPEAGFRAYTRDYEDGSQDARAHASNADDRRRRSVHAAVRGYGLTSTVDLATGLVMAFDLRDATKWHEPRVLRDVLLPRMFELSPDLQIDAVVGDAKYDDNQTHEHLEARYGTHLVAARGRPGLQKLGRRLTEADHPSIARVLPDGTLICRAHGLPLEYKGLEPTPNESRKGLQPGEAANPALFRSRAYCAEGCGKVSLATRICWSDLPYYPRTPYGRLDLYAIRRALLNRRNQVEALFSALQVGYKQGLDGAARVRVFDRQVSEALIALAFVTRALLVLHAERVRRGELLAA
jgi:Transposase DDE domain